MPLTAWQKMAFTRLSNGMRLAVAAPAREINRRWHRLVNGVASITLVVMLVFIPLITLMSRRIINPLKRLTAAAGQLTEGNYDVELDYRGEDEVGILTETFRHLVSHLRVYISDLNSMAYKDALTGIKNKSAFDLFARKLDDMIATAPADQAPRFAIVMFDCNELKEINDHYGHDKGDVYLKTASQQICNTFNHSPVFRLGGDEFAVVLQQADFLRREKLLEEFDRTSTTTNAENADSWNRVSIAKGCAVYDPAIDKNTADVLRRADEAMYRDKNAITRAPRSGNHTSGESVQSDQTYQTAGRQSRIPSPLRYAFEHNYAAFAALFRMTMYKALSSRAKSGDLF